VFAERALARALYQRTMLSARGPLLACGSIIDASSLRTLKPHLKQDEKGAETRRRLLEAAILRVIERGYANTTVRRSRSRGIARRSALPLSEQRGFVRQGGGASE
jgi:hypothetical protein